MKTEIEYVLSLSYGKDSLACLGAIEELGLPLDRIVHAEVWATDTIPADLPPMVEFKRKADSIIKARWGIEVEHFCTMHDGHKMTYESYFYAERFSKARGMNVIYGFPIQRGAWCNSRLKMRAITHSHTAECVDYVGIAEDEPDRLAKLDGVTKISPLHLAGWTEADAKAWCIKNDLLSPIYTDTCLRGGCWFCHNQGVQQLRELRKNYPDLWTLLLKWDLDSPVTFKPDGHTVHDYDRRFVLEDDGVIDPNMLFRWSYLSSPPNVQIGLLGNEVFK